MKLLVSIARTILWVWTTTRLKRQPAQALGTESRFYSGHVTGRVQRVSNKHDCPQSCQTNQQSSIDSMSGISVIIMVEMQTKLNGILNCNGVRVTSCNSFRTGNLTCSSRSSNTSPSINLIRVYELAGRLTNTRNCWFNHSHELLDRGAINVVWFIQLDFHASTF